MWIPAYFFFCSIIAKIHLFWKNWFLSNPGVFSLSKFSYLASCKKHTLLWWEFLSLSMFTKICLDGSFNIFPRIFALLDFNCYEILWVQNYLQFLLLIIINNCEFVTPIVYADLTISLNNCLSLSIPKC